MEDIEHVGLMIPMLASDVSRFTPAQVATKRITEHGYAVLLLNPTIDWDSQEILDYLHELMLHIQRLEEETRLAMVRKGLIVNN